jgi:hypothetical protein
MPKGSDLIFDHPYNAEYFAASAEPCSPMRRIQINDSGCPSCVLHRDGSRRAPRREDDSATATREPIAPANHPSSCNDHDAAAWFAGPVAAARSRPCPPERFVRRACGLDGGYSAVWLNRAHLRRRRSQPGMSCRAARPRLQAPPDGRCPGRGLVTARQGDREHPHPHRRSLLLQACTGPVCPRGRDKAGRPALPSRPRLGHITGARSRQHRLR